MRSQRRLPCGVLVLGLLAALGCKAPSPSASADEVARAPTLAGVAASALASPTADAAVASPAAADTALLRIHQINVHQGDCTLLVGPDGTTFLIDAGNPGEGAGEVVPYLKSIGIQPADGLDFMLGTHGDKDHLGGLDEVIHAGYDVKGTVWNNGSSKTSGEITDFKDAAETTSAGPVQAMPLGKVVQLGSGATATCVAVGGEVIGHGTVAGVTNENDLSVAILVRFGNFEYLTAGDMGGGDSDNTCTHRSTGQANVETPLANALRFGGTTAALTEDGLEVLDVNHHGSESSTNQDTMNLLTPTVAVINTGPNQGPEYRHPRVDVVNVLTAQVPCITAPPALVLQTDEGGPSGNETSFHGFCVGDIVIETTGAVTFKVSATGEMALGTDERVAAGLGTSGREFPLDGASLPAPSPIVITEIMRDPAAVVDASGEWFEIFNPGTSPVDINGWKIKDDDHDSHVIAHGGPLFIPPNRCLVLGRDAAGAQNGGYHADYVYSGFNLANGEDEIVLADGDGVVVDRVAYSNSWPSAAGKSLVLADPAADNGDPTHWAIATSRGGTFDTAGTDLGTPGTVTAGP